MGNNIVVDFLEQEYWENPNEQKPKINKIRVLPLTSRNVVYGLNIYFPIESYYRKPDTFERVQELTRSITHYSGQVSTRWADYYRGCIFIAFNIAYSTYNDENIVELIKQITKEISKSEISPLAR